MSPGKASHGREPPEHGGDAPTTPATTPDTDPDGAAVTRGDLPLGTRLGRYQLVSLIGAGGMGVVFAARDPELDRTVAVKILHAAPGPAATVGELRLRREGQTMARLAHPNVIRVYDVGVARGRLFVAMEYVAGGTLQQWLERAPRTPAEILAAFAQAGRGLAAAHDAGLVHRDFKPSNALVEGDGRVLVTDFGLARPVETLTPAPAGAARARDAAITAASDADDPDDPDDAGQVAPATGDALVVTRAGATVGTPMFMAPEQEAGGAVDARADQFSFCVALWRALFGAAPYHGASAAAMAREPVPPEPAANVPPRVRAALIRGLRADPAARFPSMRELLAALEPPARPRRAWLAVAGGAVVVAAGAAWLALGRAPAADPCAATTDRFAGVWDDDSAHAVRAAFDASKAPYAAATYREVARQLDDHRRAWDAMRADSCRATRVRGEQSDAMMDARTACLDHVLAELGAFVGELRKADADAVRDAAQQAAAIGDVSDCADAAVLARRAPLPADPARKAAIDALERDLAAAGARNAAGRFRAVIADGDALIARARAAGYPPAQAEADFVVANALAEADRAADAEPRYGDAVLAAEAGGDDDLRFDAEVALVKVDGYQLERDRDGQAHAERAQALLTRLGADPRRAAHLANVRAVADWWNGRYADARRRAQEAVDLYTRVDPGGLDVARALQMRAIVEQELGDDAASVASVDRARVLAEHALGAEHPLVAQLWETEGGSLRDLGRLDEARHALERGLAIIEGAPDHSDEKVAMALMNLGLLYQDQHAYDRSIATLRRAQDLTIAALGADHSRVADVLEALASVLSDAGRGDEAIAAYQRAIELHRTRLGADAPPTASSERHLGEHYLAAGDARRARPLFAEAARALEASQGKTSPLLAAPLTDLGDAALALHDRPAAAAAYQRALDVMVADPHADAMRARARAGVARARAP